MGRKFTFLPFKIGGTMLKNFNTSLFKKGDTVTVGLSGGADSVCLLLNTLELKEKLCLEIRAVHINHCLRGKESDKDELFCKKLCERLSVPFFSERIDVIDYCKKNFCSTEEGARILRYEVFERYRNGGKIATAHNLNDNAETVIFNLSRGTGLKGLTGIPAVRDEVIIRPLLSCQRNEIEEYLKEHKENFVTDSTNLETEYSRNKIRHLIIPELLKINPSLFKKIDETKKILTDEEDFLEKESSKALLNCRISENKLDTEKFKTLHTSIRRRVLIEFLKENNLSLSAKMLFSAEREITEKIYSKINVKSNVYIVSKKGILSIMDIMHEKAPLKMPLNMGNTYFSDKTLEVNLISYYNYCSERIVNKNLANYFCDYDKIQGDVLVRNRRNGDKIHLEGKQFTSSIKKLFCEKIPLCERDKIIFLVDNDGIFLTEGFGIAERVKIDSNSQNILKITIRNRSAAVD